MKKISGRGVVVGVATSKAPEPFDDRICRNHERGQHIGLTCRRHPERRWSTKNISHIGARSIFYPPGAVLAECPCPASDLRHICSSA